MPQAKRRSNLWQTIRRLFHQFRGGKAPRKPKGVTGKPSISADLLELTHLTPIGRHRKILRRTWKELSEYRGRR